MKQFILGLAVGAITLAAAERLLGPERLPPPNDLPEVAVLDVKEGPIEQRPLGSPPDSPERRVAFLIASSDDECKHTGCIEQNLNQFRRSEAAPRAEPKDSQWSHATEELLEEFIVSHRLASQFELTSVECRTTFCEIEATARDDRGRAGFERVMQDALMEPWDEFTSAVSAGSSSEGAIQQMHFRVTRRR